VIDTYISVLSPNESGVGDPTIQIECRDRAGNIPTLRAMRMLPWLAAQLAQHPMSDFRYCRGQLKKLWKGQAGGDVTRHSLVTFKPVRVAMSRSFEALRPITDAPPGSFAYGTFLATSIGHRPMSLSRVFGFLLPSTCSEHSSISSQSSLQNLPNMVYRKSHPSPTPSKSLTRSCHADPPSFICVGLSIATSTGLQRMRGWMDC
jgi:hypothetical protein